MTPHNRAVSPIASVFIALAGALPSCATPRDTGPVDVATAPDATRDRGEDRGLTAFNATPLEPGVYHVAPVLARIERVELRSGAAGRALMPADWSFAADTGRLSVNVPVDDSLELVVLHATREVPWAWRIRDGFAGESVRALFDERAGVRGVDFEVDESARLLSFLRPELCDASVNHFVVYSMQPDPAKPQVMTSVSFGNHRDRAAVRTFLGLPAEPEQERAAATSTTEGARDNVLRLPGPVAAGTVKVIVADRRLTEGEGFEVDYEEGLVTILDPAFGEKGAEFYVQAGNFALGNMRNVQRIQALLED